jgi:hypothetical protein
MHDIFMSLNHKTAIIVGSKYTSSIFSALNVYYNNDMIEYSKKIY